MSKPTIESEYFKLKLKLAKEFEQKVWNTVQAMEAIGDHSFSEEIKMTRHVSIKNYVRNTLLVELREVHAEALNMVRELSPQDLEVSYYEIPTKLNGKGENNARHSKI